ncbi:CotY/CotZ family spore coat protein [Sporosarcina thermotolerans]|uniref:CotY/CotZ family spore coat protein n=1 Tax=Sporosarcina thermotolerans TaxID=633404 RepID=A0AAW9A769_9BACL|nr:CotY/CotZ family spore coat protein [Sporosarcina thermotolerans]MDW0115476.1 CotY/CotZ family spore coat protein [Sporosarcina thermotolerans]WHT47197.1 CotY/CotZ family spore coat protein [Sporosarcina thermotolerans]
MTKCCICNVMKALWEEQKLLSEFWKGFKFVHMPKCKDTIPFTLQSSDNFDYFTAIIDSGTTPYFRLEKIDESSCCAQLRLLKPVDFKGRLALTEKDLYALKKTSHCIHVDLCCFCAFTPLSTDLLDRPLPIIESKT